MCLTCCFHTYFIFRYSSFPFFSSLFPFIFSQLLSSLHPSFSSHCPTACFQMYIETPHSGMVVVPRPPVPRLCTSVFSCEWRLCRTREASRPSADTVLARENSKLCIEEWVRGEKCVGECVGMFLWVCGTENSEEKWMKNSVFFLSHITPNTLFIFSYFNF